MFGEHCIKGKCPDKLCPLHWICVVVYLHNDFSTLMICQLKMIILTKKKKSLQRAAGSVHQGLLPSSHASSARTDDKESERPLILVVPLKQALWGLYITQFYSYWLLWRRVFCVCKWCYEEAYCAVAGQVVTVVVVWQWPGRLSL